MTSRLIAFLFAWWVLSGVVVLAFTATRPKTFAYAWRIFVFATVGGVLANLIVAHFPGVSLDQTLQTTEPNSGERIFVALGWFLARFLGPIAVPLVGWAGGLGLGFFLAHRSARIAAQDSFG